MATPVAKAAAVVGLNQPLPEQEPEEASYLGALMAGDVEQAEDAEPAQPTEASGLDGSTLLRRGSKGALVDSLQGKLTAAGFDLGAIDGDFGPKTRRALRAFQRKHGLKPDGVFGPATAKAMGLTQAASTPSSDVADATEASADVVEVEPEPTQAETTPLAAVAPQKPSVEAQTTEDVVQAAEKPPATRELEGAPPVKKETPVLDGLIDSEWGKGDVATKKLQNVLVRLGYLPQGTKLDGVMGPNTKNALMAFQVNSSGVDTIELRRDKDGKPVYATDRTRNRLAGIVDGKLGPKTMSQLTDAMKAERERVQSGLKEDTSVRSMGDNPQQRAAIASRLTKLGLDPKTVMAFDTAQFSKLGLRPHVLDAAIDGWENQFANGKIPGTVITVNDLELPNNMRRSFTIDLAHPEKGLMMQEVVAHGSGTGRGKWSQAFSDSNRMNESHQSVLGGLKVGAQYKGSKKYGTEVQGLEQGINDRADDRYIRLHGGRITSDKDIIGNSMGYNSWGCLVMPDDAVKQYGKDAKREGGRYNFNFAPHEQYWGQENDVNRD